MPDEPANDEPVTATDEPANATVTDEPVTVTDEPANAGATETPDADALVLASLKADLNRAGNFPSDNDYLTALTAAARQWLAAQGVRDDGSDFYRQILVSRAAWIYRKRVTGESEPNFLRRMVADFKLSRAGKEGA